MDEYESESFRSLFVTYISVSFSQSTELEKTFVFVGPWLPGGIINIAGSNLHRDSDTKALFASEERIEACRT